MFTTFRRPTSSTFPTGAVHAPSKRRAALSVFLVVGTCANVPAAVFDPPSPSSLTQQITGAAPSGITWAAVASGTALPIRSTGTQNGLPGAVAYFNVSTGLVQLDPRGWDISLFNITYTSGTTNTSGTTPGPLVYSSGTSPTSQTVSDALTNQRTLPAGSWTTITVAPARLAGTVSLTASPSLATSYSPGNGAANGTSPYGRVNSGMPPSPVADSTISTPGWFNQPWAFPADLVNSGSVSSISMGNWKVFGVSGQANANVLGFGNYQGVFNYTVNGVTGQQVGPVIPVSMQPYTVITVASGTQSQSSPLSGSQSYEKQGAGTFVLNMENTISGTFRVSAGTLRLANSAALRSAALVPLAGGTVTLSPLLSTTVGSLSPVSGGVIDVGNGMMTVSASSGLTSAVLKTALVSGRTNGTWTGTSGIVSSVAASSVAAGVPRTVGWNDNGNGSLTFGFAAAGDTNLDGRIDIVDVAAILGNSASFGTGSASNWQTGDFNYDGMFDILDVAAFTATNLFDAGSYNIASSSQLLATGSITAVPEPASCAMALIGVTLAAVASRSLRRDR